MENLIYSDEIDDLDFELLDTRRATAFPNLMKGIFIRNTWVSNRLVLAPVNTGLASNHSVSERLIDFHSNIARGGIGLSIIGSTAVANEGMINAGTLGLYDDNKIDGFARLAAGIKMHGSVCAIQLSHAGRSVDDELLDIQLVGPSPIPKTPTSRVPRALNRDEIRTIAEQFGQAARRAIRAGIDIIEVHCAHGYLIHQFLSPLSNHRLDTYGGSLGNRARFAIEVVETVRSYIGERYPIICRISAEELVSGGLKIEEMKRVAKWLEYASADAVEVSAGIKGADIVPNAERGLAVFSGFAQQIRTQIKKPVVAVGNIPDLATAENVIAAGNADMAAMARALIADPYLMVKTLNGQIGSVQWCTKCTECNYRRHKRPHIRCPLNPNI